MERRRKERIELLERKENISFQSKISKEVEKRFLGCVESLVVVSRSSGSKKETRAIEFRDWIEQHHTQEKRQYK